MKCLRSKGVDGFGAAGFTAKRLHLMMCYFGGLDHQMIDALGPTAPDDCRKQLIAESLLDPGWVSLRRRHQKVGHFAPWVAPTKGQ